MADCQLWTWVNGSCTINASFVPGWRRLIRRMTSGRCRFSPQRPKLNGWYWSSTQSGRSRSARAAISRTLRGCSTVKIGSTATPGMGL